MKECKAPLIFAERVLPLAVTAWSPRTQIVAPK